MKKHQIHPICKSVVVAAVQMPQMCITACNTPVHHTLINRVDKVISLPHSKPLLNMTQGL